MARIPQFRKIPLVTCYDRQLPPPDNNWVHCGTALTLQSAKARERETVWVLDLNSLASASVLASVDHKPPQTVHSSPLYYLVEEIAIPGYGLSLASYQSLRLLDAQTPRMHADHELLA
jgi:hypothetical protein